ncbi:acyl-CoA desaturase [Microlunatus spumicola]|uniref:Acyl-CoA desaturase n=1 Tax=Microlunatus spumicola TaxID=81499 RepID=A0ABP6XIG4_9ACTN
MTATDLTRDAPSVRPAPSAGRAKGPTHAYTELMQQVRAAGLLRRRVGWYVALFVVLAALTAALVGVAVALGQSWWALLVAVGLGVLVAQFGFLSHEASHREIFASGRANDRAGQIIGSLVVGASLAQWGRSHVRHHTHPNQIGADPSVAPGALIFETEEAARTRGLRARYTRRQGWLLLPLLTLAGVNLYVDGWRAVTRRGPVAGRWLELPLMLVRHGGYLALLVWAYPLPLAAAFAVVQTAVFGLVMGGAFVPNHIGMPLIAARAKVDYLHRQVLTSRNVRGGWFTTCWMGGLNYQIEHHLFPSMARPNLARAAELTRTFCTERGLTYTEVPPVAAYAAVVRSLNEIGLAAARRFDCPTAQVLGRG